MIGRIVYRHGKVGFHAKTEVLCGIPVLTAELYDMSSTRNRKLERNLKKLNRAFKEAGVNRVISPPEFPYLHMVDQAVPVNPVPFYRAIADLLAVAYLQRAGIPPEAARVSLSGTRVCFELKETAQKLCRGVREVRIDVPGEDGKHFAQELQCAFGVPIVPNTIPVDLVVSFGAAQCNAAICLWESCVNLNGLKPTVPEIVLPDSEEQPILALLWEQGRLRREEIEVVNTA